MRQRTIKDANLFARIVWLGIPCGVHGFLSGSVSAALLPIIGLLPATGWAEAPPVEEIVVTTRRREESLQEVPLAVTALSGEQLQRDGANRLEDIVRFDPSVSFNTGFTPGDTRVAIRGLSNTRGRSNVAFLVDGVDITSDNVINPGSGLLANQRLLQDLERVEIVKGPQSALFGRAAFAGAIAYTTKNPTDEFEFTNTLDVATQSRYEYSASVSGPITDTVGGLLSGVAWSQNGFYGNAADLGGQDLGGGDGYGLSGTLTFEPGERWFIKTRVAYSDDNYEPSPRIRILGDNFLAYPKDAYTDTGQGNPGIGVGEQFGSFAIIDGSGLVNAGSYCQGYGPDLKTRVVGGRGNPIGEPGICWPGNIGSASDYVGKDQPAMDQDPYGNPFAGVRQEVWQASLQVEYDSQSWWTVNYTGGYTDSDQHDAHDGDAQAPYDPFTGSQLRFGDPGYYIGTLIVDEQQRVEIASNELRFSTMFDGPVNFTGGYLLWNQDISADDRDYVIGCLDSGVNYGSLSPVTGLPTMQYSDAGLCDGQQGFSLFGSGLTATDWQTVARQLRDPSTGQLPVTPLATNTDHRSFYAMLEWELTNSLKLTLENRYVNEQFKVSRANQSSCVALGFALGRNANPANGGNTGLFPFNPLFDADQSSAINQCDSANPGAGVNPSFGYIQGEQSSYYNTPKVTLDYIFSDTVMFYTSWARAQKPGGFATTTGGGQPGSTIEEEQFDPEKMDAWEFGVKSTWDVAGALRLNASLFYDDYSDKQVFTQVIAGDPPLAKGAVLNASSAEVKGLELSTAWTPKFADELTLQFAYTWLDPVYAGFIDQTTNLVKAAGAGACNPIQLPTGDWQCQINLTGNQLEGVARNSLYLSADYLRPLGDMQLDWFFHVDANWQSKRYLDADNLVYLDDYWGTNASIGLQSDSWELSIYANNVLNDDTIRAAGYGPDFGAQARDLGFSGGLGQQEVLATLPDERIIGLRATVHFGN